MAARKMLRGKPGIGYSILYAARFRISNDEQEFVDATKAMDYIKKHILSADGPEH